MLKKMSIAILMVVALLFIYSCQKDESLIGHDNFLTEDYTSLEDDISEYFDLKYKTFTGQEVLQQVPESLHEIKEEVLMESKEERKKLLGYGVEYDRFKTKISVEKPKVRMNGNVLEVPIIEFTEMNLLGDSEEFTTALKDKYVFSFQKKNDKWFITDVDILTLEEIYSDDILPDSTEKVVPRYELEHGSLNVTDCNESYRGLNGNAAATYARTHAYNYNPNYTTYNQDCTNFISQALKAGGWKEKLGWYRSVNVWWYGGGGSPTNSFTWSAAHNFYWFTSNSGRGTAAQYFSQASVGDILQFDFTRDGKIDHAMIVTRIINGKIYVSGHTKDRRDYLVNNYFGNNYAFYLWRM